MQDIFPLSLWKNDMKVFRKRLLFPLALMPFLYSPVAFTAPRSVDVENDHYTMNFNNIPVLQLMQFVSKITHVNFLYEEQDLQFAVTIISEEQVSAKNVLSALIQVLRTHDLTVIEQENTVLITRSSKVNEISKIITADGQNEGNAALVTRIFSIKNGNVSSIANVVRPFTSQAALVEVMLETRQLIVTDVVTNVDKISELLLSLDAPHNPLEIDTYVVKSIAPVELIAMTEKILTPFQEGNPLNFVAQPETNSIYIVSTPMLLEKVLMVMEDLDRPPKEYIAGSEGKEAVASKSQFLVYDPQHRAGSDLEKAMVAIGKNLKGSGLADPSFIQALDSMRWIDTTRSLLFTGDTPSLEKIKDILLSLDTTSSYFSRESEVFMYKPKYASLDQIQAGLDSLIPSLQSTHTFADQNLIAAIQTMQWNAQAQSVVFSSDPATIERLKGLLASIDNKKESLQEGFFLYKLEYAKGDLVLEELQNIAGKLTPNNLQNQNLIIAIENTEWVKSNNSLLIKGSPEAIAQIKEMLVQFDVPGPQASVKGAQNFLIYQPQVVPGEEIQLALNDLAEDLEDSGLTDHQFLQTLRGMRYVSSTQSLIFTGNPDSLDKVKTLLGEIDNQTFLGAIQKIGNVTFLIYKLEYASGDKMLDTLKKFTQQLQQADIKDRELAKTIDSARWIQETNSLLFTGPEAILERLDQLVKKFDLPSLGKPTPLERAAPTFAVYQPVALTGDDLISILDDFMQNLINSNVSDPSLFDTIHSLKWIPKTHSILFSGSEASVKEVQDLLKRFDVQLESTPTIETIDNSSFLTYKLQFHPGNEIQQALKDTAANLSKSLSPETKELAEAIQSVQWIKVTNSLFATGSQEVLQRLRELVQSLDVPLRQVFIEMLVIETSINNTQNFGLEWGGNIQYLNKTILSTGNFPVPQTSGSQTTPVQVFSPQLSSVSATTTPTVNTMLPFSSGFDLGVIGDIIMHKGKSFISLGTLINALQLDNDSTILLSPRIITQDNRQSLFFAGQNLPYTGAIVTNTSTVPGSLVSAGTTTANVEYLDVGMSLTVTPILGEDNIITLEIVTDISQATSAGSGTTSASQLTGFQTNQTHMETKVQVPDNHFVVLSGMIDDTKTEYRTGIPCLGGLPVIGAIFSENDRTITKNNVLIFARPKIITSDEEYKKITQRQEDLFKEDARVQHLKDQFDEGLNMVKIPEE
jgi:type II secretory pathway component GspD/PulD (secretin)